MKQFLLAHMDMLLVFKSRLRTGIGKIPPESFGGWPVLGSLPVKAGSDTPPKKNSQRCGDSSGFETGRMMSCVYFNSPTDMRLLHVFNGDAFRLHAQKSIQQIHIDTTISIHIIYHTLTTI